VRLHTNNHETLSYRPGDHLGIFPGNHEELVTALTDKLEDAPPVNQIVRVEFLEERNTALGWCRDDNMACFTHESMMNGHDIISLSILLSIYLSVCLSEWFCLSRCDQ